MAMNREEWAKQAGEAWYDYGRQCWVQHGRVLECGHRTKNAHCYACNHAGETIQDAQPALPGAENVQSTENPTPEFTLPEQTAPEFTLTGQPVPRTMLRTLIDDDDLCPCGILYWQCNIHQHVNDDNRHED